jgi:hypothetical protein
MHHASIRPLMIALLCSTLIQGCGGRDDSDTAATDSAAAADTAPAAETATASAGGSTEPASAEASMTVADIDRWQRGMDAELVAVREAGTKLKEAKTSTDTMNAIFAANDMSTRAAGARGAGVDENRYGLINSTLSALNRNMAPLSSEMDVTKMPPEAVTALSAARDTALMRMVGSYPPAVVEALRPRAEALRKQEMELVAARLRAAGMVQ